MSKWNFILVALTLSAAVLTTGCSKEQGCIDPDSNSFSASAEEDDGSCTYEGRSVFWYGQVASEGLLADEATNLTFYVDNQVVGSTAASVYWTASPDCGDNASITVTKDLGGVKTQSYSFSVKDQTGFQYWSGTLNFNANTCTETELTW
ncbi:MAG: hypothetical protein ACI87N_002200 [Flavobacteriales bacterium]|jgi:hypothetical protein